MRYPVGGEIRAGLFYRPERRRRAQKRCGGTGQPQSDQSLKLCFCRRKLCPEIIETSLRETCIWTQDWCNSACHGCSPHFFCRGRQGEWIGQRKVTPGLYRSWLLWLVRQSLLPTSVLCSAFARSGCIFSFAASAAERTNS